MAHFSPFNQCIHWPFLRPDEENNRFDEADEALERVCSALKVKKLKLDCPTRWNSSWDMIFAVLKLRKPIKELTRRIRQRHYGFTEFSIGPDDILAQSVLGLVVPVIYLTKKHINDAMQATSEFTSTHAINFAVSVEQKLELYYDIVLRDEVILAVALEPRVENMLCDMGLSTEMSSEHWLQSGSFITPISWKKRK